MHYPPKLSTGIFRSGGPGSWLAPSGIKAAYQYRGSRFPFPLATHALGETAAVSEVGRRCGPCVPNGACDEGGVKMCTTPGQEPIAGAGGGRTTFECCTPPTVCGRCISRGAEQECTRPDGSTFTRECDSCCQP